MAKTCFVLLLVIFIILTVSDLVSVKAKLCEKPSKTWSGSCKDTNKCDKKCIEWEGADHGSCHQREAKYMCFCYVKCGPKDKNPAPPTEQPPKGGKLPVGGKPKPPGNEQPSPPGGGQPAPAPGGGQPSPPGGGSAPSPGGGQPSPPDGGQPPPPPPDGDNSAPSPPPDGGAPAPAPGDEQPPPPPEGSQPTPPPGCNKLVIEKLIAEALANYRIQIEKASRI